MHDLFVIDNYKPYFKGGEDNNFGVKSVINKHLLKDSGLSLKYKNLHKMKKKNIKIFKYLV